MEVETPMEIRSSGQGYICIEKSPKITSMYLYDSATHIYIYEAGLLRGELLSGTAEPHSQLKGVNIAGCFHAHLVADCFML